MSFEVFHDRIHGSGGGGAFPRGYVWNCWKCVLGTYEHLLQGNRDLYVILILDKYILLGGGSYARNDGA